jgi:hypothetical protein
MIPNGIRHVLDGVFVQHRRILRGDVMVVSDQNQIEAGAVMECLHFLILDVRGAESEIAPPD